MDFASRPPTLVASPVHRVGVTPWRAVGAPRTRSLVFAAAVALFLVSFLYVHQSALLLHLTARASELRAAAEHVEQINETLEVRRASALSLERVAEIARDQLGMVPPPVVHHIRVHAPTEDDNDG
ncbi:MAG: hypothetical protein JSW65_00975 [Candidatus Bipolaricaulota bacterium]|nr:MAG: hypothetical protein JSW65_00975 [Candidatus Bipolaricaulota bacterium]